jgi:hypothetical protein
MSSSKKKPRVREPVQVYLDQSDRQLLEKISERLGIPRAEVLRRGLRRFADRMMPEVSPGWSMDGLIGSLREVENIPTDLAENHDHHLYSGSKGDPSGTD